MVEAMESNFFVEFMCKIAVYGKLVDFYCKGKIKFEINCLNFTIAFAAFCTNVTEVQEIDPGYGKTWMFFPDAEGFPQVIKLMNDDMTKMSSAHETPDSKIKMWLYNK